MKPPSPEYDNTRFSGHLRHYHRSGTKVQKSWDEWVEGRPPSGRASRNWLKIIGAIVAILALAGIVVGLINELR